MNSILHSVSKMGVSCPLGITCSLLRQIPGEEGGEGVCAIVKGMVFKQFTLA